MSSFHQRIELTNARFVDVHQGAYFPAHVRLIVQDDKIAAMPGIAGQPDGFPADIRLDLQGKTVIPGLFNTHCHPHLAAPTLLMTPRDLWLARRYTQRQIEKGLAECPARGITHIRDGLTHDLRANRRLLERIGNGEINGPRIHQSVLIAPPGGTFTQSGNLVLQLASVVMGMKRPHPDHPAAGAVIVPTDASATQVRSAVDRAVDERQAHTIKIYDQLETVPFYRPGARIMTQAQLQAAADQSRRRNVPITMHHTTADGFRRGVAASLTSLVHLPIDAPLDDADIEACLRAGCIIEPTLTIVYFYAWPMPGMPWNEHPNMTRLAEFRRQTMQTVVAESAIPEWASSRQRMFFNAERGQMQVMGKSVRSLFRYWGRMILHGVENLRRLYTAGVPIACGNDAGANPISEAMIGLELSLLNLFLDWTPADALRAASLNSARALGMAERFGSLQPGKVADLVVLDGDPLQDASLLGAGVAATWLNGRLVVDAMNLKTCLTNPKGRPDVLLVQ